MREQFQTLVRKPAGYYGITGNAHALNQVRTATVKLWCKWLRRRSRGSRGISWKRLLQLLHEVFVFPAVRVVHSIYPATKRLIFGTNSILTPEHFLHRHLRDLVHGPGRLRLPQNHA
jgi:hypothetical protein